MNVFIVPVLLLNGEPTTYENILYFLNARTAPNHLKRTYRLVFAI